MWAALHSPVHTLITPKATHPVPVHHQAPILAHTCQAAQCLQAGVHQQGVLWECLRGLHQRGERSGAHQQVLLDVCEIRAKWLQLDGFILSFGNIIIFLTFGPQGGPRFCKNQFQQKC